MYMTVNIEHLVHTWINEELDAYIGVSTRISWEYRLLDKLLCRGG